MGFVVDKVALGQVFSEHFGFSCHYSFHKLFYTHHISGTGAVGELVADIQSGLSFTLPQEIKRIFNIWVHIKAKVFLLLFRVLVRSSNRILIVVLSQNC
jgi:hypothetical protein